MVRTNKSPEVVKQITMAVVDEAIGKTGGPLRLESFFIMAETFFTRAHTAYIAKSHGQADEFGDSWDPLAFSTVRKKIAEGSASVTGGTAFIPDRSRRQEWIDRRDNLIAQMISSGMSPTDARAKANDLTWSHNINASGVPINIDTGLLANSLAPGAGGDRSVRQGQVRQHIGTTMLFGTDVSYAGNVHRQRRILPTADKMVVWVKDGLGIVTNLIRNEIVERLR